MKKIIFILISILTIFLYGCSTSMDPADLYKNETEAQIFQKARVDLTKHHYESATKRLQTLDVRYPFGKYAQNSRLDIIYAYYKQGDSASALAAAERFIQLYPRNKHVDYAYYMQGLMRFEDHRGVISKFFDVDFAKRDLTGLKQSYKNFDMLVRYFPKSEYVPDAKQHMIYIRNAIARHYLQVAQYYFDQSAYVAAINRASEVVESYQQTPSVPKALVLMVKSYRQLKLKKEERDVLRVLKANFPHEKV